MVRAAYLSFLSQNMIFSTSGIVAAEGLIAYLKKRKDVGDIQDAIDDSAQAEEFIDRILFAAAVDNFNCFLAELLTEILEVDARPIYGKKFDFKFLFHSNDIDELKKGLMERYVSDLGYQNIDDLTVFLKTNFGLSALSGKLTSARLNRLIQMRNIITHNRGICNNTYLLRSKSKVDEFGQPVMRIVPLLAARYLGGLAERLFEEATEKFFGNESHV